MNTIISNKDQFAKSLIEKAIEGFKIENKKQFDEFQEKYIDKFNESFVMQNRPYHYNDHNTPSNKKYSYQEEIEHKHFEQYLRTGDDRQFLQTKSLQGTPIDGDRTSGAVLVSRILEKQIIEQMTEDNIFREVATVEKIDGDKKEFLLVTEKIGNLGWVCEIDDRTGNDTTPKITSVPVPLCEMFAQPKVSRNLLLNDSCSSSCSCIDITTWLRKEIADAFLTTELKAFLRGDGNCKPIGLLHDKAKIEKITTKAAKIVEFQDLLNLHNSLSIAYRRNATFVMSPKMQSIIYNLNDIKGNPVIQHSYKDYFPGTLFGFPIYLCEEMDEGTDNNHMPIIFGNFKKGFLIADCSLNTFIRDEVTEKQWVKFYTTKRVGTAILETEALKILKIK